MRKRYIVELLIEADTDQTGNATVVRIHDITTDIKDAVKETARKTNWKWDVVGWGYHPE